VPPAVDADNVDRVSLGAGVGAQADKVVGRFGVDGLITRLGEYADSVGFASSYA
jgi:hypothetical protein